MGFTVHVENFQSIESATVRVDGFTVITGRNNAGKSAFIRAIRGVFSNPPVGHLLRHGASQLAVEIRFDDGHWVRWVKTRSGKATYVVDGVEIKNVGRAVPAEVLALGVRPIRAGSTVVWPQIASQFTGQVFLLDQPGSVVAEAVSDVERVGILNRALKAAQSDQRAASNLVVVRRKDLDEVTEKIARFDGLEQVGVAIDQLDALDREARTLQQEVASYKDLRDRLVEANRVVERLAGVDGIQVPPDDVVAKARKARSTLEWLVSVRARMLPLRREVHRLSEAPLGKVPPVDLVDQVARARKALSDMVAIRERKMAFQAAIDQLSDVDFQGMLAGVDDVVGEARQVAQALQGYRELAARLVESARQVQQAEMALEAAKEAHDKACLEAQEALGSLGVCPVCGQEVSA